MISDDEPVTSADQDAWVSLATAVRAELAKMVPRIPAMTPEEINDLIAAIDGARCSHVNALLFDKLIELESAKTSAD